MFFISNILELLGKKVNIDFLVLWVGIVEYDILFLILINGLWMFVSVCIKVEYFVFGWLRMSKILFFVVMFEKLWIKGWVGLVVIWNSFLVKE